MGAFANAAEQAECRDDCHRCDFADELTEARWAVVWNFRIVTHRDICDVVGEPDASEFKWVRGEELITITGGLTPPRSPTHWRNQGLTAAIESSMTVRAVSMSFEV